MLLGIQLAAIQRPVLATFISPMDARMSQQYWNRLDAGAEIFDPVVFRAPTVFGRFTNSSPSWYTRFAAWQALRDAPDPFKISRRRIRVCLLRQRLLGKSEPADSRSGSMPRASIRLRKSTASTARRTTPRIFGGCWMCATASSCPARPSMIPGDGRCNSGRLPELRSHRIVGRHGHARGKGGR